MGGLYGGLVNPGGAVGGAAVSVGISGGNTAGNTGTVSNQVVFAGGNNVTLSGSTDAGGMTVTISGGAAGGAFTGGISGGNTLGNSGTVSNLLVLAGGNNITLSGSTNAGGMTATISGPNTVAQTNQSIGVYASSQTVGQSSSSTVDARSFTHVGQGIISVGMSAGSLLISATTAAQTNQSIGLYASSQTTGQSSSSTVDARSITYVGQGGISVGLSGGSYLISGPQTVAQTNQTLGLYASSNTTGQSSSSTVDARSLTFVGQGIASVGLSGGSYLISVPSGGGAGDGVNIVSMLTSTSGGGTLGATFSASTGSIGLMAGSNITLSQTSNTINIIGPASAPAAFTGSWFAPELFGNALTTNLANGTVYLRPFELDGYYDADYGFLQISNSASSTTGSFSGSVSGGSATSGTGSWGLSGTALMWTRLNTNESNASYNSIQTYASNTYSISAGYSASVSWSTAASSATVSITTSGAVGFLKNISDNGATTSSSTATSGSTTFSSTSNAANSFSSSFQLTFPNNHLSGWRVLRWPMAGTNMTPGEYWLGHIWSTNSGSTNMSLQRVCVMSTNAVLAMTMSATQNSYLEIGNSANLTTSNFRLGFGSYSASSQTTTAIPLSQVSIMASNASYYFALAGQTQ